MGANLMNLMNTASSLSNGENPRGVRLSNAETISPLRFSFYTTLGRIAKD